MEYVESVEDDHVFGERLAVLQGLERRTPVRVQCDDLTIDASTINSETKRCSGDRRIHSCEIFVVPRSDLHTLPVLDQKRAIAVDLEFVQPFRPVRKLVDRLRGHGCDEYGR